MNHNQATLAVADQGLSPRGIETHQRDLKSEEEGKGSKPRIPRTCLALGRHEGVETQNVQNLSSLLLLRQPLAQAKGT